MLRISLSRTSGMSIQLNKTQRAHKGEQILSTHKYMAGIYLIVYTILQFRLHDFESPIN